MRLNKYFLIAAMGLGLFACTDDLENNGGQNENISQEGTTYAAIKLNFGDGTTTRVGEKPGTGEENEGTGNEGTVKTIRLIIADASTNKVEYNKLYSDNEVQNQKENTYVIKIQPGEKKIYAFANEEASSDLVKVKENATWDGTTATLKKNASELGTYNTEKDQGIPFVMSVTEVETWDILADVTEEEAEAGTKNKVTLNVERMVAKVTVKLADALVEEEGFKNQPVTLTELTAQIGNADNIKYNKDETDDAKKYEATATSYRIAHVTSDKRVIPDVYYNYANSNADFYAGFNRANLLSGTPQSLYNAQSTTDPKNPESRFYCLENIHTTYVQANTTFVSVAATMTANKVVTISYTKGKEVEGDTPAQEEKIVLTPNNSNTTAGTFYLIENAPDHELIGGYVLETELADLYGDEESDITGTGTGPDKSKAAAVIEALKTRNYSFSAPYTDGKGYFNVWVNDLKENGKYTGQAPVFRNDWYSLTIQSIKLPGNPTPDLDPEKPLHPDTNIGVFVKIKPWNMFDIDVDLQ